MSCINSEIFSVLLSDWRNPVHRRGLPDNFEELRAYVRQEYGRVSNANPGLVYKVQNKNLKSAEEASLKVEEIDNNKPNINKKKCEICNKSHYTDKCFFRNTNFSIADNKSYYEMKMKSKSNTIINNEDNTSVQSSQSDQSRGATSVQPDPNIQQENVGFLSEEKSEVDQLECMRSWRILHFCRIFVRFEFR